MQTFFLYLADGVVLTLQQVMILLGPGLLLAFGMHHLASFIRARSARLMGVRAYIWLTAPGTVVHELSHAAFCLLFGHKIVEMKLFQNGSDGTLGYVAHTWNQRNLYHRIGNFFIGTGPLWGGAIVIYLGARLLLGPTALAPLREIQLTYDDFTSWSGLVALWYEISGPFLAVIRHLTAAGQFSHWTFYVLLYLVFCVGGHVTLSPPDLQHSAEGFGVLLGVLLLVNWLTMWMGDFMLTACLALTRYSVVFYAMMVFALALNLALALALALVSTLGRRST